MLSENLQLTAVSPRDKLDPIGFQILINGAAIDAKSEYWKYVDDLTFTKNNTGTVQGHLQDHYFTVLLFHCFTVLFCFAFVLFCFVLFFVLFFFCFCFLFVCFFFLTGHLPVV